MTAAEKERLGSLSNRLTHVIADLRDQVKELKLSNAILRERNEEYLQRIISLKSDLTSYKLRTSQLESDLAIMQIELDNHAAP